MQNRRPLSPWVAVPALIVLGGVGAGIISGLLVFFLHGVTWLAFGVFNETEPIVWWRRLIAPIIGGTLAGLGWWWLRKRVQRVNSHHVARDPKTYRLPFWGTIADGLLQMFLVSTGASLGREGAPREASAAVMDRLAIRIRASDELRGMFVAAAAGAGLAAVYHVPFAGVLFSIQVVFQRPSWRLLGVALPTSLIATWVASVAVTEYPIYRFPRVALDWGNVWWMLLAIPACWLIGPAFEALTHWGRRFGGNKPKILPLWLGLAGVVMGVAAVSSPILIGNGIALTQQSFDAALGWGLIVLAVAKMLLTSMFFAAGAAGGRLNPALAVGGAMGAGIAALAGLPPMTIAVAALAGATGVLAISQRAPLFAAIFVWELTDADPTLVLALIPIALLSYHPVRMAGEWRERND